MDIALSDYRHLLEGLLPPGPAWSLNDPAIGGLAPSLLRVHQRLDDLLLELDPRAASELIGRWEQITGLPDECIPAGTQTLRQRQQRLDAKVNLTGSISKDFYQAQLDALGRTGATITRYDKGPFTCGSVCTDAVYDAAWRYVWAVTMPTRTVITAMTCTGTCTSPVRMWGDTVAECVLQKLSPSHTHVLFYYP
ncbi:MAG TPA: YmfQ family protein [Enterobacteriaceae bacterium]|nr:YmfQ family protein [Enterobacteriaceae bacterium]